MQNRGVMILTLDTVLESDFPPFGDSGSEFGSSKKLNWDTSSAESDFDSSIPL